MKVQDLIERLMALPLDLPVYTGGDDLMPAYEAEDVSIHTMRDGKAVPPYVTLC